MSSPWHARICKIARYAGTVLARLPGHERVAVAMSQRDTAASVRGPDERRADAVTADIVQVGIVFMHVFGRNNAEAFFCTAEISPAIYRRILTGCCRRMGAGGDPESEGVPA